MMHFEILRPSDHARVPSIAHVPHSGVADADHIESIVDDASTTDSAALDDAADAANEASACLGGEGTLPNCDMLNCGTFCILYSDSYKNAIATQTANCMNTAANCDMAADTCLHDALLTACDDPAAGPFCAAIAMRIGDSADGGDAGGAFSLNDCLLAARGMTDKGRAKLQACLDNLADGGQLTPDQDWGTCYFSATNRQ